MRKEQIMLIWEPVEKYLWYALKNGWSICGPNSVRKSTLRIKCFLFPVILIKYLGYEMLLDDVDDLSSMH